MMDILSYVFLLVIFFSAEQSWAQEGLIEGGADTFLRLIPLSLLAYLFYQKRSDAELKSKKYTFKSLVGSEEIRKLNILLKECHLEGSLSYLNEPDSEYHGVLIKNEDRASHFDIVIQEKLSGKDLFTFETLLLELKNKIDLDHCSFLPTLVKHAYSPFYKLVLTTIEYILLLLILFSFTIPYLVLMTLVQIKVIHLKKETKSICGHLERRLEVTQFSKLNGKSSGLVSFLNFFEQIQLVLSGELSLIGPQWSNLSMDSYKRPIDERIILFLRPGLFQWNEKDVGAKVSRLINPSIKKDLADLVALRWAKN